MEQKPSELQRDAALAAMRQAPGRPQTQQTGHLVGGNGPTPVTQEEGQKVNIYYTALRAADFLDQIGADADDVARLYRSECQRLAEEYRRLTDQFMTRLMGPRK